MFSAISLNCKTQTLDEMDARVCFCDFLLDLAVRQSAETESFLTGASVLRVSHEEMDGLKLTRRPEPENITQADKDLTESDALLLWRTHQKYSSAKT